MLRGETDHQMDDLCQLVVRETRQYAKRLPKKTVDETIEQFLKSSGGITLGTIASCCYELIRRVRRRKFRRDIRRFERATRGWELLSGNSAIHAALPRIFLMLFTGFTRSSNLLRWSKSFRDPNSFAESLVLVITEPNSVYTETCKIPDRVICIGL